MKKKLCFVVSTPMTVKAFLYEPIKKLSEQYEIYVVTNVPAGQQLEWLEGIATVISVGIERKISLLKDMSSLIQLIKVFSAFDFDAVHSATPKAGLLAMLAAFFCRVPMRAHTFTGQVWATSHGIKRQVLKSFDWLIARLANHVLVDSLSQQQFLVDQGVVSSVKSEVLADGSISGVDVNRFKPDNISRNDIRNELSIAESDVVILYLGRLAHDKGVADLVKAFSQISNTHAQLLLVGPDESNMKSDLIFEAQACMGRVHFVGFTSEPEKYMAAADIFCLPSYREGFGNVIIEAAAVGIPSVGSRIYGLTDAIEDNVSGLLFEAKNVDELARKLEKLIINSKLRITLGQQAKHRVENKFTSQRLSDAWLEYYLARL